MPNSGLHAIVLTADATLAVAFTHVSRELGIEVKSSRNSLEVTEQLQHGAYEGVVLDFDTVPEALPVLGHMRRQRSSQHPVIFAVTSNSESRDQALQDGVHFLLKRPIHTDEIKRAMDLAYDFMLGERRRYFRCAVELPTRLTVVSSGAILHCPTINLSSFGMAVKTPIQLGSAEIVNVECCLSDGFLLRATGMVVWDNGNGQCGLRLHCNTPEARQRLDAWLDSQFREEQKTKC